MAGYRKREYMRSNIVLTRAMCWLRRNDMIVGGSRFMGVVGVGKTDLASMIFISSPSIKKKKTVLFRTLSSKMGWGGIKEERGIRVRTGFGADRVAPESSELRGYFHGVIPPSSCVCGRLCLPSLLPTNKLSVWESWSLTCMLFLYGYIKKKSGIGKIKELLHPGRLGKRTRIENWHVRARRVQLAQPTNRRAFWSNELFLLNSSFLLARKGLAILKGSSTWSAGITRREYPSKYDSLSRSCSVFRDVPNPTSKKNHSGQSQSGRWTVRQLSTAHRIMSDGIVGR